MDADVDLAGRVAVVTGGGHGLGRRITERLLAAGAEVVVASRSDPDDLPDGAGFVAVDVRDAGAVRAAVDGVAERHGRLDLAVNAAGGAPTHDAAELSADDAEAAVRLNLLAPLFVAQAANRVMQAQEGGGSIVNLAGLATVHPTPGLAAYGAARAGLVHLTQTLAVEWAPRVRVNAVSTSSARASTSAAEAVAFLASPAAPYVTGADLVVHEGGDRPAFLAALAGR